MYCSFFFLINIAEIYYFIRFYAARVLAFKVSLISIEYNRVYCTFLSINT